MAKDKQAKKRRVKQDTEEVLREAAGAYLGGVAADALIVELSGGVITIRTRLHASMLEAVNGAVLEAVTALPDSGAVEDDEAEDDPAEPVPQEPTVLHRVDDLFPSRSSSSSGA
ncbi:MAG: hypothetical protein JWL73_1838 [Actinomycetia bacterium]|nr:hypothetical protein [Actinomycetes bacterium]